MGTSKSSGGSPGGVPMVPPWTPDPNAPVGPEQGPGDGDANPDSAAPPAQATPIPAPAPSVPMAPAGRFGAARTSFGKFAGSSGSTADMRRGVGHYTKTGLGGAATAARRMGATTRTAQTLYNSLAGLASGNAVAGGQLDPNILHGRTASEVANAIVDAVRPVDGSQDAEANRDAIQDAFSQLLDNFPNADLINLTDDQRWFVVERFLATDIYNRILLDIGKHIQDKAPTFTVALQRLAEVKNYVRETVAARIRSLHKTGERVTSKRVGEIVRATIRETFDVFEGEAE